MSYSLTIEHCDSSIIISSEETVLFALLQHGIIFPYACQNGVCGTCKCKLIKGRVNLDIYSDEALTAAEFQQGLILACRARLLSDATISKLDYQNV
ncbi:2Fe-2S iron-sulfur cluster-binding protein [Burkholderiales bacterium]|nr:2Fe-2S iron-sulfur cluster-binding protein [Burkholderiales bacterium]